MKVVILCGGKGTRLREETEYRPKPLVPIGGLPILWHIMKIYSAHGFSNFILCLGYKGRKIKEFFMEYEWDAFDFTMNLRQKKKIWPVEHRVEDWNITFADTGEETMTGGRIKAVEKYLNGEDFMLTYGDGVGNVDIGRLVKFHEEQGRMVTVTVVHPQSKFSIIREEEGTVEFVEKPPLKDWVSGGFMVCKNTLLKYLDDSMFEKTVLPKLAREGELAVFPHTGFWHAMDTHKDYLDLNRTWNRGERPWKVWDDA